MQYFRASINALKILEWDLVYRTKHCENPTLERLLRYLCSFDVSSDMSVLRERYLKISGTDESINILFEAPGIKENLSWPLRQAKMNYVLGNYLGSIVLCGIVAEKLAIIVYGTRIISKTKRKKFEGMGQCQRVTCLYGKEFIDEQSKIDFDAIRKTRNSFVHSWKEPQKRVAERAADVYEAVTRLFLAIIPFGFESGAVVLDRKLLKYLQERGAILTNAEGE